MEELGSCLKAAGSIPGSARPPQALFFRPATRRRTAAAPALPRGSCARPHRGAGPRVLGLGSWV